MIFFRQEEVALSYLAGVYHVNLDNQETTVERAHTGTWRAYSTTVP